MEIPPKWLVRGYLALFALLPWSVEVGFGTWNLTLPSEPLIGALAIWLGWLFWKKPLALWAVFSSHVFLQISLAYLAWMAISAYFSSLPIVSWKYWLVEAGHWWVFAVGMSAFPNLWRRVFPWFAFSMAGLAVYTLVHHAFYHFRADQSMLAPMPFFPDHTMWAAAVAMVLFLLIRVDKGLYRLIKIRDPHQLPSTHIHPLQPFHTADFLLLLAALVFSSCRAAWVSVFLAGASWGFLVLGKKGRLFLLSALLACGILGGIILNRSLGRDVSALERVNRWHCAFRMAQERPFTGFGPGTFQFQHLDFQKPEEMTRISLREASAERGPHTYGRGGGAHSEYLRALAETGWPGLLLWLGLLGVVLWAGIFEARKLSESLIPRISGSESLMSALALLTFFAHGAVNDFLHDGRLAALVWGCMAVLFSQKKEEV